ncbi:MAG: hypothetical protein JWN44_5644 [Myxococcales bacterium]|nr:hypothetical protein [Myxococcales bacterium]
MMLAHRKATFELIAEAPAAEVGPLFGAERERVWAPGWEPRFVHPAPAEDRRGMVFTVRRDDADDDAVWVNSQLDLERGVVQYVYVVPKMMTALITLRLSARGARTHVEVTYERTALCPEANARVEALSLEDGSSGPEWERQINAYLKTRTG